MKHQHHAGKHHKKKHLIGKDQLGRQERMASLQPSKNNNTTVKQNSEATHTSTTEMNATNKEEMVLQTEQTTNATTHVTTSNTPPTANPFEEKEAHQNPLEKLGTQCKRISEHLHHILKHLF